MRAVALLAVGLALAAGSAFAEGRSHLTADGHGVELAPDERVVLRLSPGGRLSLMSITPAAPAAAAPPRPGPRRADGPITLNEAAPGTVALTLSRAPDGSYLKVDSGLDQAFDYRAMLHAAGRAQPTSVCTVLPLLAGYERWERLEIDALTLSGFTPKATNEVVCDKR